MVIESTQPRAVAHGRVGRRSVLAGAGVAAAALTARATAPWTATAGAAHDHNHANEGPSQQVSGDEARFPDGWASFTKGLAHDERGQVDPASFRALTDALDSGSHEAIESLPVAGSRRLADPLGGLGHPMDGPNPPSLITQPPPVADGDRTAAEMVELYWRALLRDVPFAEYPTHPLVGRAVAELSSLSGYAGPGTDSDAAGVTPRMLFRGDPAGARQGPLVSQLLWREVPYGATSINRRIRTAVPAEDHLVDHDEWLAVQRGSDVDPVRLDPRPRYIRNGRDLAHFVHADFTYQAWLDSALILLGMDVPLSASNPYRGSSTQAGFITFGAAHLLDLVALVARRALAVAWYHKWQVHRRLRPEAFGGRIHHHRNGTADYPVNPVVLQSQAVDDVVSRYGTGLLPLAYPEGSPMHPSYPAGHAVIAGAGATVLKAFFESPHVLSDPVVATADGLDLTPYDGPELTVGGELDKMATNMTHGRDMAGVHYRSDGTEGLRLGETVAIALLRNASERSHPPFDGWTLTAFDGREITT